VNNGYSEHQAGIAQLVEQRTENPRVGGSSPPPGTLGQSLNQDPKNYWGLVWGINETMQKPFQQRLSLGALANPAGLKAIGSTVADTRIRQRFVQILGAVACFADITLDFGLKSLRGDYEPKRLSLRNLPTDLQIVE
jgi:hypothetical protein